MKSMTTVTMPVWEYDRLRNFENTILQAIRRENDEDAGEIFVVSLQRVYDLLEKKIRTMNALHPGVVILFDDFGVSLLDPDAREEESDAVNL